MPHFPTKPLLSLLFLSLLSTKPLYATDQEHPLSYYKDLGKKLGHNTPKGSTANDIFNIKYQYTDQNGQQKSLSASGISASEYNSNTKSLANKSFTDLETDVGKLRTANDSYESKALNIRMQTDMDSSYDHYKNPNASLYNKSFATQSDPQSEFDKHNFTLGKKDKKYKECEYNADDTIEKTSTETCHKHIAYTTDQTCLIGQKVDILAKNTYQCKRQLKYEIKKCRRERIVTCKEGSISGSCNSISGVSPLTFEYGSDNIKNKLWSKEEQYTFNNGLFQIGNTTDNALSSNPCGRKTVNVSFNVKNVALIKKFTLTKVTFDDHLNIRIFAGDTIGTYDPSNEEDSVGGKVIYTSRGSPVIKHTTSGSVAGMGEVFFDSGKLSIGCEQYASPSYIENIDIRPLLTEGKNTIMLEVFVGGGGEAEAQFDVDYTCCNEFEERWGQWQCS